MKMVEFGILNEDEVLSTILDKTLCAKALLEKTVFPDFPANSNKYDREIMNIIFKENLEYLTSNNSMNQKILQAAIYNLALMYKIAFLLMVDSCAKNPGENFDEVIQNFIDEANSKFYELCAEILGAKKVPAEKQSQDDLTNE